jgi:hemerythrin
MPFLKSCVPGRRGDLAEFKWDSRLETGISSIDSQHKELFKRIENLELAMYSGRVSNELVLLVEYLESYAEDHFNTEESMMLDMNYPHMIKHIEEHKKFRDYHSKLNKEYRKRGAGIYLAIDVDREIRKWWESHILGTDMQYVPYYKNWSGAPL